MSCNQNLNENRDLKREQREKRGESAEQEPLAAELVNPNGWRQHDGEIIL